jgi:hypothetical protein
MREKQLRPYIKFRIVGSPAASTVRGQEARALAAMIAAGTSGITALEVSTWALRLAHYCWKLRKLGLVIECRDEAHAGIAPGKHGRYFLHSAVETIEAREAA